MKASGVDTSPVARFGMFTFGDSRISGVTAFVLRIPSANGIAADDSGSP